MNRLFFRFASFLLLALIVGCGDKPAAPAQAPRRVDDGSADVAKGLEALAQQDVTAAAAHFATAVVKCETNFAARLQLALVKNQLGDVAGANAAAAEALALCPDSAEAHLVDGQAAYLQKDYARALADFTAVTGEKSLPAALRSEAWSARGVVELAQDQPEAARISFLRAMRLNRRNASAWYHLGVLLRDNCHFNEAACEQFEMAGRLLNARDPRAKKISRDILPELRRTIAAAQAAKPGVAKRDPEAAAKLLKEGQALHAKRMTTMALKKYDAALAADPLSGGAALASARLRTANAKTDADVDRALAAFRAAIDQNPASQAVYLEMGQLAYKNKRWSTTVAIMDRAVAHDPENCPSLDLLVAALQKAGKGKQAEAWKAYRAEVKAFAAAAPAKK